VKVWHCNFKGHYPVGAAAVVVAENNIHAAELLNVELAKERLKPVIAQDMIELDTSAPRAVVLCNGNY
jgi:hypothetical protein